MLHTTKNRQETNAKPRTIEELCDRAEAWADSYYQQKGRPTGEASNIKYAIEPLVELAPYESLDAICYELVSDCVEHMVNRGLSRRSINDRLRRIKTVLRWAAKPPRRWISAETLVDVSLVEPLKRWRTKAPESDGVKPVSWELVQATIRLSPPWLAVMIWVHWWCGCRPSEVVSMRKSEIVERDGVLIYSPSLHKTAHHGNQRHIIIGPRGQELLRPWMTVVQSDDLFHIRSKTGYRQAVQRVCDSANIERWVPAQIRHSYMTRVGNDDLDGARAVAGHSNADTTLIYVEKDIKKAIDVQLDHG